MKKRRTTCKVNLCTRLQQIPETVAVSAADPAVHTAAATDTSTSASTSSRRPQVVGSHRSCDGQLYVQFQVNEAQANEMIGEHAKQYKMMARSLGPDWATFVSGPGCGVWTYFVWILFAGFDDQSARLDPWNTEIINHPRWLIEAYNTAFFTHTTEFQ
jgi:hypothetical protein